MAKKAATQILASYPDYGKIPPEYVVQLTRALETFSIDVIQRLGDIRTGLPAKCKFSPTVQEVMEEGNRLAALEDTTRRYAQLQRYRVPQIDGPRTRPQPFPRLWEEFGDDFLKGRTFETLFEASKRLATRGAAEAREYLDHAPRTQTRPAARQMEGE